MGDKRGIYQELQKTINWNQIKPKNRVFKEKN
jgi:hypothetical protein